jgi:gliding motility-associated-like protein
MKKIFIFLFSLALLNTEISAQTAAEKLSAHFTFDDCNNLVKDYSAKGTKALLSPVVPKCICGVEGGAIQLNGNEWVSLIDATDQLTTANLSVSLYFKPLGGIGNRDIISNIDVDSCANKKRVFTIRYNASARSISVIMKDDKRGITLTSKIDNDVCWQHIVVTREANYHRLWLNGKVRATAYSPDNQRVQLKSNSLLTIGRSGCNPNILGGQLKGLVDDVRIYGNFALSELDVKALYKRPDQIKTADQVVFLGNEVSTEIGISCADKFAWLPTTGVDNPNKGVTKIKPEKEGVYNYVLRFTDSITTCAAYDTLRITVVNPKTQPCGELYLPNAFTPNGDTHNETFGISNPYTIDELVEFEILDRWGGRIFTTKDPFQQWDGTINGTIVMPGEYLYRIRYNCQGQEKSKIGSFVVLQ